ncbi:histone H2A-beta, sperm-like [Sipha flava]|uniref:Histone H2A n=1 Tax=Sipha flava TaxID=143950 RepID=A0A8B8GBD3_9HEMI|nr:histone H2A-beta, sperm-like [Sipha flava]
MAKTKPRNADPIDTPPGRSSAAVNAAGRPGPVARRRPRSRSKRAGLQFPVVRIHAALKRGCFVDHVRWNGSVYVASVLEYLSAEMLELAGDAARDNQRVRITPRHILLAVRNDLELSELLRDVTFADGGVMPHIEQHLLPKKTLFHRQRRRPDKLPPTEERSSSEEDTDG